MDDETADRLLARMDVTFGLLQTEFGATSHEILFHAFLSVLFKDPDAIEPFLESVDLITCIPLTNEAADVARAARHSQRLGFSKGKLAPIKILPGLPGHKR